MSADHLTLHCPEGHAVVPSRFSVAAGMYYCPKWQKHNGHKAYYALRELHTLCCDCGFRTPPEGDCSTPDGHNVCGECAMAYINVA